MKMAKSYADKSCTSSIDEMKNDIYKPINVRGIEIKS